MRLSCNGCRVLRKGCGESCSIRPCLQWIKSPEAQSNAVVFLAKFYGRAGLMNLIDAGPEDVRPAIFRSLLYEACGRIVNPVYGSVGLLWSGSWNMCQAAVEAVLKGAPIVLVQQHDDKAAPANLAAPASLLLPTKQEKQAACHYDIRHNNSSSKQQRHASSSSISCSSSRAEAEQDVLHKVAKPGRPHFKRTCCANNKQSAGTKQQQQQEDDDEHQRHSSSASSHVSQAQQQEEQEEQQPPTAGLALDLTLAFTSPSPSPSPPPAAPTLVVPAVTTAAEPAFVGLRFL